MVVSGHVVLALIWVTYDEQYPSQEMVQVRWRRQSVTRGVRMERSNQGEIDGQHVGSDSSKAVAICGKGWDKKVRNENRVLHLFTSKKQDSLLRMKPPCSFENRLQQVFTD